MIKIDFNDVDQDIILFSAFRYCLGRRSYVVGTMVQALKDNWNNMPLSRKEMFKREIREAIELNCAGSKYDVESWESILKLDDYKKEVEI